MSKEYCYSWNRQEFRSNVFPSIKEALAEAVEDGGDQYSHVYIGEVSRYCNSSFFPSADYIIEHMADQAADVGGEFAEGYPDVSEEAEAELTEQLTALLDAWCEKHGVSPRFWEVVNVKEHRLPVTAEATN